MTTTTSPSIRRCALGEFHYFTLYVNYWGRFLSELFRNALWLNYLEKPSELKFLGSE
jgi:hypothetical protein